MKIIEIEMENRENYVYGNKNYEYFSNCHEFTVNEANYHFPGFPRTGKKNDPGAILARRNWNTGGLCKFIIVDSASNTESFKVAHTIERGQKVFCPNNNILA